MLSLNCYQSIDWPCTFLSQSRLRLRPVLTGFHATVNSLNFHLKTTEQWLWCINYIPHSLATNPTLTSFFLIACLLLCGIFNRAVFQFQHASVCQVLPAINTCYLISVINRSAGKAGCILILFQVTQVIGVRVFSFTCDISDILSLTAKCGVSCSACRNHLALTVNTLIL